MIKLENFQASMKTKYTLEIRYHNMTYISDVAAQPNQKILLRMKSSFGKYYENYITTAKVRWQPNQWKNLGIKTHCRAYQEDADGQRWLASALMMNLPRVLFVIVLHYTETQSSRQHL